MAVVYVDVEDRAIESFHAHLPRKMQLRAFTAHEI